MRFNNLVQECEQIILTLSQQELLLKGQRHLHDAISFKTPDNSYEINKKSTLFRVCYLARRSTTWNWILFILSFVYMYLIIGQQNNRLDTNTHPSKWNIGVERIILALYWIDLGFQRELRNSDRKTISKRYWFKNFFISLLTIDQLVYLYFGQSYPIRPFRFIRAFMPYFYEPFSRKAITSLISTYRDIIAYLIFYGILIFGFAFAANQVVNLPDGVQYDEYMSNYGDIGKMSFLIYVLASYDAWPDYQLKAVDANKWNYVLFVSFIFLNCFYFVTIPTTVIFNSFKNARSKMVLLDQIKQKQSLILCYKCLQAKGGLTTQKFSKFMMRVYKQRPKYVSKIIYMSSMIDPTHSGTITLQSFTNLNEVFNSDSSLHPPLFSYHKYYDALKSTIKYKLKLKSIINSDIFELIVMGVILLNMIVIILSFTTEFKNYELYQSIFFMLFGIQMITRVLGSGLQQYFLDKKNWLDIGLFAISFLLVELEIYEGLDLGKMARMVRLFRFSRLTRILLRYKSYRELIYEHPLCRKLRILFGQLLISCIVGLKMFPIFCTCFYILGLIGMQLFDNRFNSVSDSPYRYSLYDNYSSFRNLIQSQLVIVQVMIEAGWSPIVFDYSYRYNNFYGVALFFVLIHVVVVIILVSLMKGLVADLYETIYGTYIQIQKENIDQAKKQSIHTFQQHVLFKQELVNNNKSILSALKKIQSNRSPIRELFKMNCENIGLQSSDQKLPLQNHYLSSEKFRHNSWIPTKSSILQEHLHSKTKLFKNTSKPLQSLQFILTSNYFQQLRQQTINSILTMEKDTSGYSKWQAEIRNKSFHQYQSKTHIDIDQMMRKVFLSGTSQNVKQQLEREHLWQKYKKSINYTLKSTNQKIQKSDQVFGHLRRIIKSKSFEKQILRSIVKTQQIISKQVIGQGCFFKLIIKIKLPHSGYSNWGTIQIGDQQNLTFQLIKSGFWIDEFSQDDQVHIIKDIFGGETKATSEVLRMVDGFSELKSFSQYEEDQCKIIDTENYSYSLLSLNLFDIDQIQYIQKASVIALVRRNSKNQLNKQSFPLSQKNREDIRKKTSQSNSQIRNKKIEYILDYSSVAQIVTYFSQILKTNWEKVGICISDFVHKQII